MIENYQLNLTIQLFVKQWEENLTNVMKTILEQFMSL